MSPAASRFGRGEEKRKSHFRFSPDGRRMDARSIGSISVVAWMPDPSNQSQSLVA
jgi:hypothetical protein